MSVVHTLPIHCSLGLVLHSSMSETMAIFRVFSLRKKIYLFELPAHEVTNDNPDFVALAKAAPALFQAVHSPIFTRYSPEGIRYTCHSFCCGLRQDAALLGKAYDIPAVLCDNEADLPKAPARAWIWSTQRPCSRPRVKFCDVAGVPKKRQPCLYQLRLWPWRLLNSG